MPHKNKISTLSKKKKTNKQDFYERWKIITFINIYIYIYKNQIL